MSYERTGSVSYTVDGQVFGGKIDMVWQGNSRSSFSVSGSFGLTLLDLETRGDTILVIQGDQTERYLCGDPMSKVPFFEDYPFTFGEAIRIISGSYIQGLRDTGKPDSVTMDGRQEVRTWVSPREISRLWINGGSNAVEKAEISPARPSAHWKISFSGMGTGLAERINCELDSTNSIAIRYGAVRKKP